MYDYSASAIVCQDFKSAGISRLLIKEKGREEF
jgi:hypothetical protein